MSKFGGTDEGFVIKVSVDDLSLLTSNAGLVAYYICGWILTALINRKVAQSDKQAFLGFANTNTITKDEATTNSLPYKLVEQREKRALRYSSRQVLDLVLSIEACYKRHGNQRGFAQWGGELFLKINNAIAESKELYEDKFLPCL